jgi:hypothetical protein
VGGSGGPIVDGGKDVGPDVTAQCGKTHDRFDMQVSLYDGRTFGCGVGKDTGVVQLKGQITASAGDSFTLDSCPPNADCMPMFSTITLPGSDVLFLPVGGYVTLSLRVDQPWGCSQQFLIMNLPIWGGVPNPYGGGETMIFAAADGVHESLPEAPFLVEAIGLGCSPGAPSCGGDPTDDYMLHFFRKDDPTGVTVPMGMLASWMWSGPEPGYWAVTNLRSYASGACDDYWNWGYRLRMQGIK